LRLPVSDEQYECFVAGPGEAAIQEIVGNIIERRSNSCAMQLISGIHEVVERSDDVTFAGRVREVKLWLRLAMKHGAGDPD